MATKKLNKIFLSASIPQADRPKAYYETADVIAIRDAVRALAAVVIPKAHLIWGGHPSITPLIRYVMERMDADLKTHVTLYQSNYFRDFFPSDNFEFEDVILTTTKESREDSLLQMRLQMFKENDFKAAVFIGGMEGVFDEYTLFREYHPNALVLPVASTGAAAKMLYENDPGRFYNRLTDDYAYMAMFKDLLSDILK